MSKHSEYQGSEEFNEDLEKQLVAIRKKDRIKLVALGIVVGLMVAIGAGSYISELNASSAYAGANSNNPNGNISGSTSGSYTATNGQLAAGSSSGGGCGGSSSGGCGMAGGGALGNASLSDLEKQGLDQYKQEQGVTDVTAKAANFGCHIQIDISDKSGTVVRSYGFQGGPLYVIK